MAAIAVGAVRDPRVERIRSEAIRALNAKSWLRSQMVPAMDSGKDFKLFGQVDATEFVLGAEISAEIRSTVKRIAAGILFDWNPDWVSSDFNMVVVQKNESDLHELIQARSLLRSLPHSRDYADGIVYARWGFAVDNPRAGAMLIVFYGTLSYYLDIRHHQSPRPMIAVERSEDSRSE